MNSGRSTSSITSQNIVSEWLEIQGKKKIDLTRDFQNLFVFLINRDDMQRFAQGSKLEENAF